ncbi:MAG: hypothetical protein IJ412_06240 [Oscillospiraceae bacterium]|nr:hypothetical protein [Oscillospiraceae bacterium]
MTGKELFTRTLKCEPVGGQVPTFELTFFLTMEAFGKLYPGHRSFSQWDQMSTAEQKLHIDDIAETYILSARRYGHSAIFVQSAPWCWQENVHKTRAILSAIREKTGDEYFLLLHGDPTWAIPDGDSMMDFSIKMYEEPEKLKDAAARSTDYLYNAVRTLDPDGSLLDGLALCSDYCFNVNPFFSPGQFAEFVAPYLKQCIDGYRSLGKYTIKHTDGNIMPILDQIAACRPDAIHSLDPQAGVTIPAVRRVVGEDICLIGNVNCGLLQTGTDEEVRADCLRSLREGMAGGRGYIFSTSNCVYTGLALQRYEMMMDIWRKYGNYGDYQKNFG